MDRRYYQLEDRRRTLALLSPRSAGLDREEAMRLIAEMQDLYRRLDELRLLLTRE